MGIKVSDLLKPQVRYIPVVMSEWYVDGVPVDNEADRTIIVKPLSSKSLKDLRAKYDDGEGGLTDDGVSAILRECLTDEDHTTLTDADVETIRATQYDYVLAELIRHVIQAHVGPGSGNS